MEKSDRPVDYGRLTVNITGKETSEFENLEDGLSSTDLSNIYKLSLLHQTLSTYVCMYVCMHV